jgi:hypothetical protein
METEYQYSDETRQIMQGLPSNTPEENPLKLGDSGWSFIDADTLVDSKTNTSGRLRGINALETNKFIESLGYKFKQGEVGGDAATAHFWNLANKHGFTNVVTDGKQGKHDRSMIDMLDNDGYSFVDTTLKSGLAIPWGYSDQQDQELASWGSVEESLRPAGTPLNDFEKARKSIQDLKNEHYNGLPIQKFMAFNAAEYNSNPEFYMGMKTRNVDADFEGNTRTPFGTGWDLAFGTLWKSYNQVGQKIANSWGLEDWETDFARNATQHQEYINSLPKLQMDVTEIDWGSYEEVTTGIQGMLGMSVPFMAVTMAGMAAAPFTGGLSYAAPVSLYTGMVLDEMEGQVEDKNFGIALSGGVAMTVLDRLGIKGLITPKMMMTAEGRTIAIDAISKSQMFKGLSPEVAKNLASRYLLTQSKKQILGFVQGAKAYGQNQIAKGVLFKEGVKRLSKASASEGTTEAMQELTQYTAAVIGSEKEWDFDEVQHLMTNAIVAGGLMGGQFAAPGFAMEIGGWKSAVDWVSNDDGRFGTKNTHFEDQLKADNKRNPGVIPTLDEVKEDLQYDDTSERNAQAKGFEIDRPEHYSVGADDHIPPGTTLEKIWAFIRNPLVSVKAGVNEAEEKASGLSVGVVKLSNLLGSTRNRLFPGPDMMTDQRLTVAEINGKLRDQELIEADFKTPRTLSSVGRSEYVSDIANRFMVQVLNPAMKLVESKDGKKVSVQGPLDWSKADADLLEHKDALLALDKDLQGMSDFILQLTNKTRDITGEPAVQRLYNWAYRHKSFRREYISANRKEFSMLLSKEYGFTQKEADGLTDKIINSESINTIEEAFDITKGGVNPSFQKKRQLHISDRPAFSKFVEQNIFKNMADASREAARFKAHREFLGKDGINVSRLFQEIHGELLETLEPAEARKLLNELKFNFRNLINAESGNYKPIQNQLIKSMQKYLTMLTTLQSLAMAAVSSVPEAALLVEGVPKEVIVKNAASSGYLFGSAIGAYLRNLQVISRTTKPRENMDTYLDTKLAELRSKDNTDPRFVLYTNLKEMLKQAGFKSQETGAATSTGVQDTNELTRGVADAFFKANFLHDQQDMHRTIRLSFFNDFLINKLDIIKNAEGVPDTVGVAEAKSMLRELGVPVNVMLDLGKKLQNLKEGEFLSDKDAAQYKRQFLSGAANFVNQAIPLPNALNRPLYYSDPHFVMLTQFNGFTSTFTANQIPRLWDQLKGNSSKGLQYGTVAALSNMLVLAFLSHGIKDELKYGETSPYLTDAQKIQRAIYSSGLLGTTERVIGSNFLFPLYGSDTYGTGDFLWENVAGEAAVSSTVARFYNMIEAGTEGDGAKFERNFYGSLPIIGPFKHRLINYTWD